MAEANGKEGPKFETIKLTDGRVVDFVGKRKMNKESFVSNDGTLTLRIDFRNGETRTYPLNPALIEKFALHGAEQKYGDEVAGTTDEDDMVLAIDELHARLSKGEWGVKREGGGIAGTSVLLRALVEFTGKPIEKIKEFLQGKTQAEKMALRIAPGVREIVERLEKEKAEKGAKVDTGALLAQLEGTE